MKISTFIKRESRIYRIRQAAKLNKYDPQALIGGIAKLLKPLETHNWKISLRPGEVSVYQNLNPKNLSLKEGERAIFEFMYDWTNNLVVLEGRYPNRWSTIWNPAKSGGSVWRGATVGPKGKETYLELMFTLEEMDKLEGAVKSLVKAMSKNPDEFLNTSGD